MPTTRDNTFRVLYANAVGVVGSDNDFQLRFAIDVDPSSPGSDMSEQAYVVITPKTAKILAHVLMATVGHVEERAGEIVLQDGKLEAILASLHATPESITPPSQTEEEAPARPTRKKARSRSTEAAGSGS